jgi:hypothetical protein
MRTCNSGRASLRMALYESNGELCEDCTGAVRRGDSTREDVSHFEPIIPSAEVTDVSRYLCNCPAGKFLRGSLYLFLKRAHSTIGVAAQAPFAWFREDDSIVANLRRTHVD